MDIQKNIIKKKDKTMIESEEKIIHLFKALSIPNSCHKWKIFYGRAFDLSISELEKAIEVQKAKKLHAKEVFDEIRKDPVQSTYPAWQHLGPVLSEEEHDVEVEKHCQVVKALRKIIAMKIDLN